MSNDFTIIPVLDLKSGAVVHARAGDRANYRPIETPLAAGSSPRDVLAGLLALAPFRAVYIADLDAIEGKGGHDEVLRALRQDFPSVAFWLDRGIAEVEAAEAVVRRGFVSVVGSESLTDAAMPQRLNEVLGRGRYVLSLDHRGDTFLGPAALATEAASWPDRVIVMTLDRVGASGGPDFERLAAIQARAGARQVFAAGGVRGADDVAALQACGIAGALVASAIHDGRLTPSFLSRLTRR
jgi:phosphoribosylformimino-5-aminoimidazole carboxamide ribotide isomerase